MRRNSRVRTIFKVSQAGQVSTLYNFCNQQPCTDGISPWTGLLLGADGNFYGTTYAGGNANKSAGTIFKITPTGRLTTLYTFCHAVNCLDGAQPTGQLIQANDGNFYGTTRAGGRSPNCTGGCGTVFRFTPQGTLTTLYSFTNMRGDGAIPAAGVTQGLDGNFYGTTSQGGNYGVWCVDYLQEQGCGTVFRVTPSGTETILYHFCKDEEFCSTDGALPFAGLLLASDGNFYGTTEGGGGADQSGAIFKITPEGQFTELYQFCSQPNCSDGTMPVSTLIQGTDGALYGSTSQGGSTGCLNLGCGTVFRFGTAGFATLHTFQQSDGWDMNGLIQSTRGYFLGTAYEGGESGKCFDSSFGCGTVFGISTGLGPFVTFVHAAGTVGQTSGILGQELTGTTSVSFNGVNANFTVISETLLTATVPPGASTGFVTVTTSSGTLTSNVAFQVLP